MISVGAVRINGSKGAAGLFYRGEGNWTVFSGHVIGVVVGGIVARTDGAAALRKVVGYLVEDEDFRHDGCCY